MASTVYETEISIGDQPATHRNHWRTHETLIDIKNNGKGRAARNTSMSEVQAYVDARTHVTFPVLGNMDDEKYLKEFVFVPVAQSPGIAFISLAN